MSQDKLHPYSLQSFYDCWWEHLSPKFNILQAQNNFVIHRRGIPGKIGLKELRYAGWNSAWSQDFGPRDEKEFLTLLDNSQWDYFYLIWQESRKKGQAFKALRDMNLTLLQKPVSTAYWIDLSNGFDCYLNDLSAGRRKDIQKKLRKAAPLNPEMRRFRGEEGIEQFFSIFFKHHIKYWDQKTGHSYFNDPRERNFIQAWAKSLEKEGRLLLEGFYLNNTLSNLTMNILINHTLYSLITINTGAFPEHAPGLLSLYYRMKNAQEYNILANRQDPYYALIIANPKSIAGITYLNFMKYKNAISQVTESFQEWLKKSLSSKRKPVRL
jgi:hypothetical protein